MYRMLRLNGTVGRSRASSHTECRRCLCFSCLMLGVDGCVQKKDSHTLHALCCQRCQ